MSQPTVSSPDRSGFLQTTYRSAWQTLMFNDKGYDAVLEAKRPFWFGGGILLVILLTAALAQVIGVRLDLATLPKIDLIQASLGNFLANTEFYQQITSNQPLLGWLIDLFYGLLWTFIRVQAGYPVFSNAAVIIFLTLLDGLFYWMMLGYLASPVARLLGGGKGQPFFGVVALALSPYLLYVVNVIPGLSIPGVLVQLWILGTSYQVVQKVYGLTWGRTAISTIAPYILSRILGYLVLHLGVWLGVTVYGWIA